MKLLPSGPNDSRRQRAERLRRARTASLPLRRAFPDLEQLRLNLQFEDDSSTSPAAQFHVLHPPARAFFSFPCPYADCDGGFDLDASVKHAIAAGSSDAHGVLYCAGERPRKGLSKQPCLLKLNFHVDFSYGDEANGSAFQ